MSVRTVVDFLVQARLLVVQSRGDQDGPAVEIVHESLILSWPTLRRWLEENQEDSAFLEQLRHAAKQWDTRDRPGGLLWRGEAMEEARRFERRYKGELPGRERDYLGAVISLATKAARQKRRLTIGAFGFLVALVAAALVALVFIRDAQKDAEAQRFAADQQKVLAEAETAKAQKAQADTAKALATVQEQIDTIKKRERERDEAKSAATVAEEKVKTGEKKLALTGRDLVQALEKAKRERAKAQAAQKKAEKAQSKAEKARTAAEKAAAAEKKAKQQTKRLLAKERRKVKALEEEKKKLSTRLK